MLDLQQHDHNISGRDIDAVAASLQTSKVVKDYTHAFYRYPARFSPLFARTVIDRLTNPGDVVLDPFLGGGTTLVESYAQGRVGIGFDVSSLATFVASVKTTSLDARQSQNVRLWADYIVPMLNTRLNCARPIDWIEEGYQHNINNRDTWALRKLIELALDALMLLDDSDERDFLRCAVLRTAQWALDSNMQIPSANAFRGRLRSNIHQMLSGLNELFRAARNSYFQDNRPIVKEVSAANDRIKDYVSRCDPPRLVLTSPPYPGVHVLYHRWQVRGRRETPAPFWIANCRDGAGASFYTMGHRSESGQEEYFANIEAVYRNIAGVLDRTTRVVQLVGFSDRSFQLERFLKAMNNAGYEEIVVSSRNADGAGRIWRSVPNRRWYNRVKEAPVAAKEVLLIHRLRNG